MALRTLCIAALFTLSACEPGRRSEFGLPIVVYGDTVPSPQAIACMDAHHAVILTARDGIVFAKLDAKAGTTVFTTLQRPKAVNARILAMPNRVYANNRTDGLVHVYDTTNPDAPSEIGTLPTSYMGSLFVDRTVYASDPVGIVPLDLSDLQNPIRGEVGKMFQPLQKFSPAAGEPLLTIGDVLFVQSVANTELYTFDISNRMAPTEIQRINLLDPSRPASRKVVPLGWQVHGNFLYGGALQLPDPPEFPGSPRHLSLFVLDVTDPRNVKIAAYPKTTSEMPRLAAGHPLYGILGILGYEVGGQSGALSMINLSKTTEPANNSHIDFGGTLDSHGIHDACFAGDTLVAYSALRAGFAAVQ